MGKGFRMKRLLLASIFCLAFAVVSHAQDKPQLQIIPPANLLEFPPKLVSTSVSGSVQGLDFGNSFQLRAQVQAIDIELKGLMALQTGLCSVPLLEAHVDANDPGIAVAPRNAAVPIPQARVPAPSCQKK